MKNLSENLMACGAKRRRVAALQDAGASTLTRGSREASWTAPVLPRRAKARQRDGGWRFCLALVLTLFIFSQKSFAADTSADFAAANKLYAEGKFAEASSGYDAILKTGAQSPALLFNAGNAAFKAGHLGQAIAAYRQAELLTPRDAELRANLAFVRNQVQGATLRASRWQNWVNTLTLNEGALLTAAFFWAMFGMLALRQLKPALAPKLRTATRLTVALTIFSSTVLALQAANRFNAAIAVVTSDQATARSGPFNEAQSVFTARDGAELKVLNQHDDWVQVANNAGKIGWLSRKQVAVLPGA
jgi:tetratricopeptide (TPR) repeat protein